MSDNNQALKDAGLKVTFTKTENFRSITTAGMPTYQC